jgi:PTH1 family peptidyl-tRNA hydrolase
MNANLDPVPDVLIVGLGNPGPGYARSRHNLGWLCLEELARRLRITLSRKRWDSRLGSGQLADGAARLWLMMPQTMMNLSGGAVRRAVRDLALPLSNVWLVYDELDLPLCRLRIRVGGSAAGHNGVRSVIAALGSGDFVRFRVGVGRPAGSGREAGVRHVLGRFSRAEQERLGPIVAGVADALELALRAGVPRAMDVYNRAGSLDCEELA